MPRGRAANRPSDVFKQIKMGGPDLLGKVGQDACWPWTGAYSDKNLPYFRLNGKLCVAYRVVLSQTDSTFNFDDPFDLVRHKCNNVGVSPKERCCNPTHLTHGTHQQNMDDMKRDDRHGLSKHVIRYIRKLLNEENPDGTKLFTHSEIARRYGVSRQVITAINNDAERGKIDGQDDTEEENETTQDEA